MTKDKDSLVEMLSKIPITETKGSLLSAIGKLLRVIDISESSIMIPTLLKDKCEFDAYEMLTLAKVLKASILGHNDLVEFYMSESSSPSLSSATTITTSSSSSSSSPPSSTSAQLQRHQNSLRLNGNNTNIHSNGNSHVHQLSATPSLRSSSSDQSSSAMSISSPSTPIPPLLLTTTGSSFSGGYSIHDRNHHHNHHHKHQSLTVQLGANGDPDATVRLLLQIEQLKTFIPQVTGIFESIIELYKNSVDTITYGNHSHK